MKGIGCRAVGAAVGTTDADGRRSQIAAALVAGAVSA